MKVKQLSELLSSFEDDMEVKVAYNYGDHWRTKVAPDVCNVEITEVEYSDYHRMDRVIDREILDDEEYNLARRAVVLFA